MKLKLFLIAASAMALASCSSDEVVKNNEDANAIKFSVVANNGSRAADYYCNQSKPADFQVWAAVNNASYFAKETFKVSADGATYKIDGDLRYWPSEEVTFVAARNYTDFDWKPAGGSVIDMTVQGSASAQKDLIFAVTKATRGTEDYADGQTNLNFRHALSQVVFEAKNSNGNIYVEINQIKVCNISSTGKYTLPTPYVETKTDIAEDANHTQQTYEAAGRGTWGTLGTAAIFDTGDFGNKAVPGNGDKVNLTNDRTGGNHAQGGVLGTTPGYAEQFSLLLLPQKITAWTGGAVFDTDKNPKTEGVTGAYFLVYCKIRNVEDGNGTAAATDNIYLWGDAGTYKAIAVPVTTAAEGFTWEQGKKYIYTLNFTDNGHGGFNPEDGEDVLIPIEFTVTVDDFAEVTPGQEVTIDPAN